MCLCLRRREEPPHAFSCLTTNVCVSAYIQDSNGETPLDEGSAHTTRLSLELLGCMFRVPAATAEMVKADLAGSLLQIMQDPHLDDVHQLDAAVMGDLCLLNRQPAGRQQLLQQLNPDSCRVLIQLCLKHLEAPVNHAALVCAAGELLDPVVLEGSVSCSLRCELSSRQSNSKPSTCMCAVAGCSLYAHAVVMGSGVPYHACIKGCCCVPHFSIMRV